MFTNFDQDPGATVIGNDDVTPLVSGLFLFGRPLAVALAVRAIVVNSIQGVGLVWFWTHVLQKLLEAIDPFLADRDSPPSPSDVVRTIRIKAPVLHGSPRLILWSFVMLPGVAVNLSHFSIPFISALSTAIRGAANQVYPCNGMFCIASRAFTNPLRKMLGILFVPADDGVITKYLSDHINCFSRHILTYPILRRMSTVTP